MRSRRQTVSWKDRKVEVRTKMKLRPSKEGRPLKIKPETGEDEQTATKQC